MVAESDLEMGSVYPPLQDIQKASLKIAVEIVSNAYKHGKKLVSFKAYASTSYSLHMYGRTW